MAIKRIRNHGKWVWPGSYSMIHAFAGDNLTSDVVACGVAVFQEDRVAAAEELLRIEKVAVGIPADERLHCRVMFSDHGRNAAGIPGPRARGPWAASSIRAMIFNPLYRGELVWGWTRWAPGRDEAEARRL